MEAVSGLVALPHLPAPPAPQAQPCSQSHPGSRGSVAPQSIPGHSRGTNGHGWELSPHPSLCCWEISSCFPLWPELCLSRGISGFCSPQQGVVPVPACAHSRAASPGCPELAAACRAGRAFPWVFVALSSTAQGKSCGVLLIQEWVCSTSCTG